MGERHQETQALGQDVDPSRAADRIGYPIVVKPARGAGSHGLCLARNRRELRGAVDFARRSTDAGRILLQRYVRGAAASVSLLANGRQAVALTLNAQAIGTSPAFSYRGGQTPFDHPLASRAIAAALDTCRALPGLRGFVGVDLVLTASDAVVIEVNPRITTAYLGVRAAFEENVAAWVLAACGGDLPSAPRPLRRIRFTASGRVVVVGSAHRERGAA